jgi:hypothetical protein
MTLQNDFHARDNQFPLSARADNRTSAGTYPYRRHRPGMINAGGGGPAFDWSIVALGYKLNPTASDPTPVDNPDLVRIYAGEIDRIAVAQADITVADNGFVYVRRTIADNTMLVATAASVPANDATYLYYRLYQFTVTAGVASIKLILRPFDIDGGRGFTGTVTVISSMQYASNALQYKTKLMTYSQGSLLSVGTESGWNTLFTAVTGCP